tara:strand:- start:374 stop:1051 length:678 start_codon:yes stop_codon:yes gene_type:complete
MNEFRERRIMANNLENCIRKAGKTKKEVAAAKGVTPETLSRHMHGRIQMTMLDAEEYARILNVPVQRILFKEEPIPVIGDCLIKEKAIQRTLHDPQRYQVYVPGTWAIDVACFTWKCEKPYQGIWYDWDGCIQLVKHSPIVDKFVDPTAIQHIAAVKTKRPIKVHGEEMTIIAGVLYPQPKGLWTVHNGKMDIEYKDLELEWATPMTAVIFRPDLRGVVIEEINK